MHSHHVFVKILRDVQLAEVGPRFEMKRECQYAYSIWDPLRIVVAYEIRQGTIEQTEAEREWVLSHYTRTAKKRNALSGPSFTGTSQERPSKKSKR
jgi:U3 small nucleolar ribonucleoprotein protein IMP4